MFQTLFLFPKPSIILIHNPSENRRFERIQHSQFVNQRARTTSQ